MHWLFQLYTSNVYYLPSSTHCWLRHERSHVCSGQAGPGAQPSSARTPSTVWTRARTKSGFAAAGQPGSPASEGTAVISVTEVWRTVVPPGPRPPQHLGHPNAAGFTLWHNSVGCNETRSSLSVRRQSVSMMHKQNCLHAAASAPQLSEHVTWWFCHRPKVIQGNGATPCLPALASAAGRGSFWVAFRQLSNAHAMAV